MNNFEPPYKLKIFHGRYTICDNVGRERFILQPCRPSIEAWKQLSDDGNLIAELMTTFYKSSENEIEVPIETNGHTVATIEPIVEIKKRGRPKGSKNK